MGLDCGGWRHCGIACQSATNYHSEKAIVNNEYENFGEWHEFISRPFGALHFS